MYPLRELFELLGANVKFSMENNFSTVSLNQKTVKITVLSLRNKIEVQIKNIITNNGGNSMDKVLEFLKDCKTFFIATTEEGKPKVRPFGFVMTHEDKLYFSTGNQKPFFKQIKVNPEIEICGLNSKMEWIRLSGKAVPDSRLEIKQKVFEVSPFLINTYKTAENPTMECFYIDEAKAEFCKINGTSSTITL